MARGQRPGRAQMPRRRAGRPRAGRERGGRELPTALPGSADAPAMPAAPGAGGVSSTFGGAGAALPPARRGLPSRGGPRPRDERRHAQRVAAMYDFRYVHSDLRWIFATTAASVALILIFWLALRV